MSQKKQSALKDPSDEIPPRFSSMKVHPPSKDGKIPIKALFDGIYETAATGKAKTVAPRELELLKENLDDALKQMLAIADKIRVSQIKR
jgi:hypothetical protein